MLISLVDQALACHLAQDRCPYNLVQADLSPTLPDETSVGPMVSRRLLEAACYPLAVSSDAPSALELAIEAIAVGYQVASDHANRSRLRWSSQTADLDYRDAIAFAEAGMTDLVAHLKG